MSTTKRNALLLLSAVGLLALLLAMSLPNLDLSPGQPFSFAQFQLRAFGTDTINVGGEFFIWVARGIMALALILFPFVLVHSLMTPEGRRRLLTYLILTALIVWLANYLRSRSDSLDQSAQSSGLFAHSTQAANGALNAVLPVAQPPEVTFAIILGASILAAVWLAAALAFFWQRLRKSESPLDPLAVEAQNAIEAIHAGRDLKTTIVHCYREMSRVVGEERGIARGVAMTPREFEDRLISKGLPQESIGTLTRLFERVRYGSLPVGRDEEELALSCLTSIVTACTGVGRGHESQ